METKKSGNTVTQTIKPGNIYKIKCNGGEIILSDSGIVIKGNVKINIQSGV